MSAKKSRKQPFLEAARQSQEALQVLSLSQVAATLGVGRHVLAEWVRLGLVPTPYTMGRRRNGRITAYAFLQTDLPALTRLAEQLKKGVVPK